MSSPVRAVERQCTRRRSSPSSYSRNVTNSSPRSLTTARCADASCSALMRLPTATGATMSCTRGRTTSSASPALGSLRRATPNGSVTAIDERARRGSGRVGGWGCGTPRAPSRRRRAGARGTAPRAGLRRTSRWRRAGGWRARRGSRPSRSMRPSEPTCSRSGCTRRLTASVGGDWKRSQPRRRDAPAPARRARPRASRRVPSR